MANDLEVKVVSDDCMNKAADYTDAQDPDGTNTPEEDNRIYQAYYQGCEDAKKTPAITAG
jgi:hypothetical protein